MIREQAHGPSTIWEVGPIAVQTGRDWRLVVSATSPGTCDVVVSWIGGERTIVSGAAVDGPTVIALPQRFAGRSITLRCRAAKAAKWAMTLTWTPDLPLPDVVPPC